MRSIHLHPNGTLISGISPFIKEPKIRHELKNNHLNYLIEINAVINEPPSF